MFVINQNITGKSGELTLGLITLCDLPELASKMHIRWLTVAYNLCFRSDVFF